MIMVLIAHKEGVVSIFVCDQKENMVMKQNDYFCKYRAMGDVMNIRKYTDQDLTEIIQNTWAGWHSNSTFRRLL